MYIQNIKYNVFLNIVFIVNEIYVYISVFCFSCYIWVMIDWLDDGCFYFFGGGVDFDLVIMYVFYISLLSKFKQYIVVFF